MLQIIKTKDGSVSLLNSELNETYHSIHGARQESMHVFIKEGLKFFSDQNKKNPVRILEIGFGTGLNALLTAIYGAEHRIGIEYSTLEAFPINESLWQQLNFAQSSEEAKIFFKLHHEPWEQWTEIVPGFMLRKINTTLQLASFDHNYFDLVYFDAFAPNKQPEMWTLPMLQKTIESLTPNGVFVTYCAKGQLKRDLASFGTTVQTLQGPPGKREMIRAIKH
ncbi:MAG TPA: tRNA (5-methylaminomethyl-2-thiouridine)(34)-methyltransferase MnmD [Cyclobacteriaceae bacterium]|nr:tRNA (5-methylaminomethyl-2-thiouridine)(34)-methyltransferase MnmD [Cyclobacteriaceae bacterium]HMV89023.1 tRNA (5-methylaminomethyl-2-thiouridine)(34)-methyltransferase MnmD [Cyclobacteriaceae bacterium]HMW98722.1 tRNA (5-methylaminomethyl-2-thiouridine)(34)-methyltransferase MnmD [Cyclobacteriaceae bacterium]HMX48644.1 tRNA (5-methylaminomethyl-2-thiouridine)(34)-methyltransferase MnmD [Cyclobacteriaceae bacterium]HMY95449.1 tRNA (5-methylaminomethyl-2-thiouridine)(34)-methyltransferase M